MRAEEIFSRYKDEICETVIFSPKVGGYSMIKGENLSKTKHCKKS